MATNLTSTTFSTTYKDDYKDSDNYHRILFNSGKALQARELTQLQTIIQNEVRRMGSNIFKEGGVVIPGGLTTNRNAEFIKLTSGQLPTNLDDILGKTFTVKAPDPAIQVKIIKIVQAENSDPDTLYVEYVSTSAGTSSNVPIRVNNGATLENTTLGSSYDMVVASTDATGRGNEISVSKGAFYVQGHFVFCEPQSFFLEKYSPNGNGDIGFKVTQQVITATDNNALYDNQGAAPNIAAPGADRFQIKLTLTSRASLSASDNFVYLGHVFKGFFSDEVRPDNSYSILNDVLAQRTREESGDYIVKPFIAQFETKNDSNLTLNITDGIAYVDGSRVETKAKKLNVPKPTDTITIDNETIVVQYGNYILTTKDDNKGMPNTNEYAKQDLRSAVDYGGSTIGSARVRSVENDGVNVRLYLFDLRMNAGSSFSQVKSIGTSASSYNNLVLENSAAVLKSTGNNDLLMPLPRSRPKQSAGTSYDTITFQQRHTISTGAGVTSLTDAAAAGSGLTYSSTTAWVVSADDSAAEAPSITLNGTNTNYDISGLKESTTYEVYALVTKGTPTKRAKTLTDATVTKAWPGGADSDGTGTTFLNLDKTDIFTVSAIKQTDSDGADLSDNFTVDNGQRDNYYGFGRLVPKGGVTIPTGNIYVKFKHFTHGTGDFFDVTSYNTSEVAYKDIPNHRQANGDLVSLRDVVDFRPVAVRAAGGGATGQITFDSDGASGNGLINKLPQNTDTFTGDITYHLPRNDRLIISTKQREDARVPVGRLEVIQGVPSLDPQLPEIPTASLPLYNIELNANTLDDSDLSITRIPAKRYTMADIAQLEERIDKIEELTSLSLLELDTQNLTVIDSAGLERTKAGFLVDNFRNFAFAEANRDEYRATIDFTNGHLTPSQKLHNIRLIYDSADAGSTTVRKGDNLYLPIDSDVLWLNQNLATETENVNPHAVITSRGHIDLSPETDNWVETQYIPANEVSGGEVVGTTTNTQTWASLWSFRDRWIGRPRGRSVLIRGTVETRREIIADRIVDVDIIPFMRSIEVFFRAQGLRRNTRHFPYFGGTAIDDFTRSQAFSRWSTRNQDVGNLYTNRTTHPDGSNNLVSDSAGGVTGSFIIPSTSALKFRTGTTEFKLLDVTGGVDSASLSGASAFFTASGVLNTRQQTIRSTRVVNRIRVTQLEQQDDNDNNPPSNNRDPVAQSFLVSSVEHPNGMFITKVRTFFETKEDNFGVPVSLSIVPLVNGYPDELPIPGAVKFLQPSEVNIPSNLTDLATIRSTPTDFQFDEPVYLAPNSRYAVVIKAESTAYRVYVAKTYDFVIGSTEARVNRQPTLGSFFTSQNAATWTADQDRDLMFGLFHAQFQTSATAVLENASTPKHLLGNNPLLAESNGDEVRVTHPGHGFIKNDFVTITGLDSTSMYAGLRGVDIMGSRQITKVDHTGYTFNADSNFTGALRIGGNGVIATSNQMYDAFIPQVSSMIPTLSSLSAKVKLTEGASYANNRNTASGYSRAKASSFSDIALNDINFNETPKMIATDSNESISPLSGNKSLTMQMTLSTEDIKVSPVVDLQRSTMALFENVIDKQDSAATVGFNIPINFVAETHPTDGTSAAKHITRAVTLEEPSVGLKILFAANRPSAARFKVYFKTGTSDDNLDDINWVYLDESTNNPADENKDTFRQYEYLAGGQVGNLDTFSQFQIKIVMESTNSSKIPLIKDLRTIAMVT